MIKLRPYQESIIHDVRQSLSQHDRVILQMEVGGGKTIIASEIIRMAIEKGKRVLFIAPRRQLIYQTVDTLKDFNINCGVIMAGERSWHGAQVQVASFDTITARVGSGRMELPEADLVIQDEAHMTMSPRRVEVLSNYKKVIGLTATPALANGKGMGSFYEDIVVAMPMQQMINEKHLVPMRYFIGEAPDLTGAKLNKDGDYTEKYLEEKNDTQTLIGAVFKNWHRIAKYRTTLVFAVNRKHAVHLHDEFLSHGVTAEYIDGLTPPEEREEIKARVMSGKTQVIVNIGVMVAGVSWNRIRCIVMARQTRNIAVWRQCCGRGSRLYPEKDDCLIIYHGDNFDELGMLSDPIEWSLDDKSTIKERKEKADKEKKEPKPITCKECQHVYKSRRDCPQCGFMNIAFGEPIPCHEADLVEVKKKLDTPAYKAEFYAMLLGMKRGEKFALAVFKQRFDQWPNKKRGVKPIQPSQNIINYITSRNIAYAKRKR